MILLDALKYTIFPGILTILCIALISSWFVRKLTARIENRIGPPVLQPVYDVLKLFSKEKTYPKGSFAILLSILPKFQLISAVFLSLLIPVTSEKGLISFNGDIFLFLFLLSLHGIIIMFVGYSSNNPYTSVGYGRLAMSELSFELPLIFSISSLVIVTKSTRISEIILGIDDLGFSLSGIFIRAVLIVIFVILIYSGLGFLEFNPFSAAHAETEIVGGWQTELTGADLGYIYLSDIFNIYCITGLISALFIGTPEIATFTDNDYTKPIYFFVIFLLKFFAILSLLIIVKTISSRIRIDQTIRLIWNIFLPISMFSVLIIYLTL